MKKKYNALDAQAKQLENENSQLRWLYRQINALTEDEAYKVFNHIRATGYSNPIDALRLLDQDVFLNKEGYNQSPKSTEICDNMGVEPINKFTIEVQALPWTTVATDEVISELISQYFMFDYLYVFPPIVRSKFIHEMKFGDIATTTCCSPLLVNAICAHQCVSC